MSMSRLKILWMIIRRTHMDKLVYTFTASLFIVSFVIMLVEPFIDTYGDGLWYTFVACTTIGFGDFTAVTVIGRILTVYMALHEILMVAVIPGVIVSYYLEVIHRRENEKLMDFLDKMENLPDMSKKELEDISDRVRELRASGRI